jgi:alpha-tubulin suppressor-like RCC1 family protein
MIVTTKDVYATGENSQGQLGGGNTTDQRGIVSVSCLGLYKGVNFTGASIGNQYAILTTGVNNINTATSYVGFGMGSISYHQLGSIIRQQRVPTVLTR